MNQLDTDRISRRKVYKVWHENGEYIFQTDHGIVYAVGFDEEDFLSGSPAYWLGLTHRSGKSSPNDPKVRAAVIGIIEEFFLQNPDILLYMCDTADEQQAQRNRLFLRWFNGYEQQQKYCIHTAFIVDEGIETYVALIVQRSNPHLDTIIAQFDEQTMMFKENKPE